MADIAEDKYGYEQVRQVNSFTNLVNYIIENYQNNEIVRSYFDMYTVNNDYTSLKLKEKVGDLVKYLLSQGYDIEEIKSGRIDYLIEAYAQVYTTSIRKDENDNTRVKLESKKQKFDDELSKKFEILTKRAIAIALSIALSAGIITFAKAVKEKTDNLEASNDLGEIATEYSSLTGSIYEQSSNIVKDELGTKVLRNDFNPAKAAEIILKVTYAHPDLFDLCMADLYCDSYNTNKLKNMDDVIKALKNISQNSLVINEDLKDCEVFLDYLAKNGYITIDDNIANAIAEYKNNLGDEVPYYKLSSNSKKIIDKIVTNYKDESMDMHIANKVYLDQILNNLEESSRSL